MIHQTIAVFLHEVNVVLVLKITLATASWLGYIANVGIANTCHTTGYLMFQSVHLSGR